MPALPMGMCGRCVRMLSVATWALYWPTPGLSRERRCYVPRARRGEVPKRGALPMVARGETRLAEVLESSW